MSEKIKFKSNPYLDEQQRKKKGSAYYGEFFLSTEFDDGWDKNLYNKFLQYCKSLEETDLVLKVFNQTQETLSFIKVILNVDEVVENTEKNLLETTTNLQKSFLFTPIFQNINYGFSENTSLPIEIEEPKKSDINYNRYFLQNNVIKEILFLQQEIDSLEYTLKILGNSTDDEIVTAQKNAILNLINTYKKKINNDLIPGKNRILDDLNLSSAIKPIGTETKIFLSEAQQEAIIDFSGNNSQTNGSKLLSWMRQMEDLHKKNLDFIDDAEQRLKKQTEQLILKINGALKASGLEIIKENAILTDYELDYADSIIKAKFVGRDKAEVYKLNGAIKGFRIEGVEKEIKDMYLQEEENDFISLIKLEFDYHSETLAYLEGDSYSVFKVGDKYDFYKIKNYSFSDGILKNVFIGNADGTQSFAYLENGQYKYLELNGENSFEKINILSFRDGKPLNGYLGYYYYFYLDEDGEYKYLEIEGETKLNSHINVINKTSDGIPLFGEKSYANGFNSYFINKNGKFVYLNIEGETKFKSFDFDDKFHKSGVIKTSEGLKAQFYLDENGEYKYKTINGEIFFRDIISYYEEDGKFISAFVLNKNNMYQFIYSKNGENKKLEINGIDEFDDYNNLNIRNGILEYVKLEINDLWSYIYYEDGEYKILEIDGKKQHNGYIQDLSFENGIIKSGQINNGNKSYFYLDDDGKYKTLNIEGDTEFDNIYDVLNKNNKILYGNVKLTSGYERIFYLNKNGNYKYLKIEGKEDFYEFSISSFGYLDDKLIYGRISTKDNKKLYFYLDDDGKYKLLSIEGIKVFDDITIEKIENGKIISGFILKDNKEYNFYLKNGKYYFEKKFGIFVKPRDY